MNISTHFIFSTVNFMWSVYLQADGKFMHNSYVVKVCYKLQDAFIYICSFDSSNGPMR